MKYDMFALICCIYFTCLVFCLFICLYPINVKAGKPIHPKCCVGPHLTPREGFWTMDINFLNVPIQIEILYNLRIFTGKMVQSALEYRDKI